MAKTSLGIINWWGFSPALDFFENGFLETSDAETDINILLIGCGDNRHILKTISSLKKSESRNLNFFVVESGIELYARHMLQVVIALIPQTSMGLQDKTELFLELYGNGLVRQQSMDFVRRFSTEMTKLVTDPESCARLLPFLDLAHLKFKERDVLEHIFKMWRHDDPRSFDSSLCWDLRLRDHLGVRYDAIPNVFDWDCSMTLHDRGAGIVNSREYGHWRHKGVAFRLRDANYDVSNRTLASGRLLRTGAGDKTVRLGYWGDIVCSPYLALGIASTDQSLFKKANNQFVWGASRISEHNVTEMFHQLAFRSPYVAVTDGCDDAPASADTDSSVTTGGKVATISELDETELDETECAQQHREPLDADPLANLESLLPLPRVTVSFLPLNALADSLVKKTRFERLFDVAYFSTSLVGQLESCSSLPARVLRPEARVVVETPRFIVDVTNDQNDRYREKVDQMARVAQLKRCATPDAADLEKWGHLVYVLE